MLFNVTSGQRGVRRMRGSEGEREGKREGEARMK